MLYEVITVTHVGVRIKRARLDKKISLDAMANETGLKVIDLIAPFTKGGKTGVFGGAGVGKTVIIMELIRVITSYSIHYTKLYDAT